MRHFLKLSSLLCILILELQAQGDVPGEDIDMANEVFDDQYIGCIEEMENKLDEDQILDKEKMKSKKFKRAWEEATSIWQQQKKQKVMAMLPHGFKDLHGISLVASSGFIRDEFNNDLKSADQSYEDYMEKFHFKFLHFYLTGALELLSGGCKENKNMVYSGIRGIHYRSSPDLHVRFGQFLSTSRDIKQGRSSGNDTFLTISTCYGVDIEGFSQFPLEKEVLVPGYEVFKVVSVSEESREIILSSTNKTCSNFNCAYIRGAESGESWKNCSYFHDSAGLSGSGHFIILLTSIAFQVLHTL
ncbi:ecto-ADP-ribosyltransferase 5-like isoform 1-T2 [Discoglossus pictus]